jgi:hypothetical protein
MNTQQNCLACAVLACLSGLFGQAYAGSAQTLPLPTDAPMVQAPADVQALPEPTDGPVVQAPADVQALPEATEASVIPGPKDTASIQVKSFPGTKYSLSPLPVDIYMMKGQKPTVAFTTPCIQIEKLTHGFPPIVAFETFMFTWIGNVNDSELLPVRLEPVCI